MKHIEKKIWIDEYNRYHGKHDAKITYGDINDLKELYEGLNHVNRASMCSWYRDSDSQYMTRFLIDLKGSHTERTYKESGRCAPKFVYGLEVECELHWNWEKDYYDVVISRVGDIIYNHWEGTYWYIHQQPNNGMDFIDIKDTNNIPLIADVL